MGAIVDLEGGILMFEGKRYEVRRRNPLVRDVFDGTGRRVGAFTLFWHEGRWDFYGIPPVYRVAQTWTRTCVDAGLDP